MERRTWEPQWDAYLLAQEEHRRAIERLKTTPEGDKESFAAALTSAQLVRETWSAFGEAFDREQFR